MSLNKKTMIKFIKSGASVGFAHAEGDEVELSATAEKELVEMGFAVEMETTEKAIAKKPKTEKAVSK